jgi:aspartate/methionine/tyrosine aminotransferase
MEDIFWDTDLIKFIKPKGAFYSAIIFNLDKFPKNPTLKIENENLKGYIEWISAEVRFDKKFCYYMMASAWICTVPLSWFNSTYHWFRMTLLEEDLDKFKHIVKTIKKSIIEFSKS